MSGRTDADASALSGILDIGIVSSQVRNVKPLSFSPATFVFKKLPERLFHPENLSNYSFLSHHA